MSLRVRCPKCGEAFERPDADVGSIIRCPECNQKLSLNKPPVHRLHRTICPICGHSIGFSEDQAGTVVACPGCSEPVRLSKDEGLRGSSAHLPPESPPPTRVSQIRPWVRYIARMIDVSIGGMVIVIVLVLLYPAVLDTPELMLNMLVLFLWVFVEATLLSTWGTTPGKWLLKTRLRNAQGEKPTFSEALTRSFRVWWRGMGTGFPIASLITTLVARGRLKDNGITTWDRDGGFVVTHQKIGIIRIGMGALFFVGLACLIGSAGQEPIAGEFGLSNLLTKGQGRVSLDPAPPSLVNEFWQEIRRRPSVPSVLAKPRYISTAEVAKFCGDSVLSVEVYSGYDKLLATGSGILITERGAILTNRHVVSQGSRVLLRSRTGWYSKAPYLIADLASIDIALLHARTPPIGAAPAYISDVRNLQVGDSVVAIGNPLGLEGTVSEGIISGFREIGVFPKRRLLQTTAPISPGSSGGGLFDRYGCLVGITSLGSTGEAQNINFAVPLDEIFEELLVH